MQQNQVDSRNFVNGDESIPPPLPRKRRSQNSDMINSFGSIDSQSSGQITPTGMPNTSLISSQSSDQTFESLTPSGSLSPGSSMGSNLNNSSCDDLHSASLGSGGSTVLVSRSSHSSVFSRTSSESHIVSSTVLPQEIIGGGKTFAEINALTSEIKKLTSSINEVPPPLPAKKGPIHRLMSQYDNLPDVQTFTTSSVQTSSRTVISRTVESTSRFSSSSSSSGTSQSSLQRQSHSAASFLSEERTSSAHETYSSSETFSSASHSSTESLPKPPPLPPKKRHSK